MNLQEVPIKKPYSPQLFISRQQFINLINEKIEQINSDSGKLHLPLIRFWGIEGIGKTWLLRHIHSTYTYRKWRGRIDTCTAYIDFEESMPESDNFLEVVVSWLANSFHHQIKSDLELRSIAEKLQEIAETKNIASFLTVIEELTNSCIPLILFDHLRFVEGDLVRKLEKLLLEPLLMSDRVLILISSRSRTMPALISPEIRRRQESLARSHVDSLSPEDVEQLCQQMHGQEPAILEGGCWQYSGGNPWLTTLLEVNNNFSEEFLANLAEKFHAILFGSITDSYRSYLDAIGILRTFRYPTLRFILESEGKLGLTDIALSKNVRQFSREHDEIVWWDKRRNKYVTDIVARIILTQYQRFHQGKPLFKKRHKAALHFFQQQLENFQEITAFPEICYHQAWLWIAENDTFSVEDLWLLLEKTSLDRPGLRNLLDEDHELSWLFPADDYQNLLIRLE